MLLLVSDEVAVMDNVLGKLYLVVYADPREPGAWRAAQDRLRSLRARLASPLPEELSFEFGDENKTDRQEKLACTFTEEQFLEAVAR